MGLERCGWLGKVVGGARLAVVQKRDGGLVVCGTWTTSVREAGVRVKQAVRARRPDTSRVFAGDPEMLVVFLVFREGRPANGRSRGRRVQFGLS